MKLSRFIKNAAVLTVTALLLRIAGMIIRVFMANTIGSEGMGFYQMVFSVYVFAATFASNGFSVAVTRLICEEKAGIRKIQHILLRSMSITLGFAFITMAIIWLFADEICLCFIKDIRAVIPLKILSVSLPFMAINCNIRGYFIAKKKVSVPSNAQLFEQAVRIILILVILPYFAQKGIEYACAAILTADTVAEGASTLFIYTGYRLDLKNHAFYFKNEEPCANTVKKILKIAMPITGGRYLTSLLRTAENLLVPNQLAKYNLSREMSVAQFGDLKGMALPLIFFPSSFLSALSTLLVPELSNANANANSSSIKSAVNKTIRFTLLLSVFIGAAFYCFAEQIALAVYSNTDIAFYLKWLSPLIPLMYLESITAGMMQGLDQQTSTFTYNLIDSLLRIALILVLLPKMGIEGFMIVMVISNLLTSLLNLFRLFKVSKIKFKWLDWAIIPSLVAVFSVIGAKMLVLDLCSVPLLNAFLLISISALIYFVGINIFSFDVIENTKRLKKRQ